MKTRNFIMGFAIAIFLILGATSNNNAQSSLNQINEPPIGAGKIHITQKGETFPEICLQEVGDNSPEIVKREAKRLGLKPPYKIHAGQILSFPLVYRISWICPKYGESGHEPTWILDAKFAYDWVKRANRVHRHMFYWVEVK